ncbi:MAG: secretion activating protein [Cyanobacteria bacterium REEB67]|nr:secretion activating protein [Cyanobacteria bacterium REEB67]
MNTARFFQVLAFTTSWEGGYVNHPADAGLATNFGISQKAYDKSRREAGLELQSVQMIERLEVFNIYKEDYWLAGKCEHLAAPLDLAHFDTCVNFGVSHAAMFLQQALGVTVDGVIGGETLKAAKNCDAVAVAVSICEMRIGFRYDRCEQRPDQKVFLQGWLNRDNALKKACQAVTV